MFSLEDDKVDQTEFPFLYEIRVPMSISSSKHESILLKKAVIYMVGLFGINCHRFRLLEV